MNACSPACGWCGRCTDDRGQYPSSRIKGFCAPCGRPLAYDVRDEDGVLRCPDCRRLRALVTQEPAGEVSRI